MQAINANMLSAIELIRATVDGMIERRWGRIVNITSEVFHRAVAPFSAYVAAKGGLPMYAELAPLSLSKNGAPNVMAPMGKPAAKPQG